MAEHNKSINKYDQAPQLIKDFLFYMLTIRGRSARTVEAYYIDLRTFFRFYKQLYNLVDSNCAFTDILISDITIEDVKKITLSDVYSFLNYAMAGRENQSSTRARKVSSIRSFFKYLTTKTNLLEINPVKDLELPSSKKTVPKFLTLEESITLLNSVSNKFFERNTCILIMFLNCGMRLSELVGINLNDIRDNTIKLLGKGNKERIIYLNDACLYSIELYLKVRKQSNIITEKNALFVSSSGSRLSPRRIEQIVEECLKAAGLSEMGYSPHKLRHTAATLMYQHGGVDMRILKEILGHANIATTEIYTHVSDKQIENAASATPLAGVKIKRAKINIENK